jgi:hypothetical protein
VRALGLVAGTFGGLGLVVLVQQAGVAPLSRAVALLGASSGVLTGIVVPSTIYAVVLRLHNRRLASHLALAGAAGSSVLAAVVWAIGIASTVLASSGGVAGASPYSNDCYPAVNGVPMETEGSSHGVTDPFEVARQEALRIELGSFWEPPLDRIRVWVEVAGFDIVLLDEASHSPSDMPVSAGRLSDSRWIGSGSYQLRVEGFAGGSSVCDGSINLLVKGSPLSTPVGQAATGLAVLGVLGAAFSAAGDVRDGQQLLEDLDAELAAAAAVEPSTDDGDDDHGDDEAEAVGPAGVPPDDPVPPPAEAEHRSAAIDDALEAPDPPSAPDPPGAPDPFPGPDPLDAPDPFDHPDPFGEPWNDQAAADPFEDPMPDPFDLDDPFSES